ncbi:MAG: hypothetical protein DMD67_11965 [Gemmatimonadetes bacterium]|nr:MAG: hypothetical protein DMD67_11965 [Gemmatimonadota bacterium]
MRFRRHIPPVHEWNLPWRLPEFSALGARRWALALVGAMLGGYLTAYLFLFPAPLLTRHGVVPRVLGLSLQEASEQLRNVGLQVQDGGTEPHPTAPQGVIIWQDPPPGVTAPAGLRVTLVASEGPPKIAVPDVAGLDGPLAQRLIAAAGLSVAAVESVQAAAPPGVVVVSRGAPTIAVPDLLGLSGADARTRLELDGLALGTVTRRRTRDANPGTVVAQKPAAGTLAAPGTVIDIVVARSP